MATSPCGLNCQGITVTEQTISLIAMITNSQPVGPTAVSSEYFQQQALYRSRSDRPHNISHLSSEFYSLGRVSPRTGRGQFDLGRSSL